MSEHLDGLHRSVLGWIGESRFDNIKEEAARHVNHVGADKFVEQLVLDFLTEHAKPFQHELEWENFTLQVAMSIWFSDSNREFDLYVLPCDEEFDFTSSSLATNGWLTSRGENLEQIMEQCRNEGTSNSRVKIVRSTNKAGVSFCFIPILHKDEGGKHSATVEDVRLGLRELLKTIVFRREDSETVCRSVFLIPFGLEVLSEEMDGLIWVIWNELRTAGRTRPYDIKKRIDGLTIRLAFGLPNVVNSFLSVMLDEGEVYSRLATPVDLTSNEPSGELFPPRISTTWIKRFSVDFLKARADADNWPTLLGRVGSAADDLCTNIQHNGGLVGVTLRDKLNTMFPERIERMLIARRVVVAHNELVKVRKKVYSTLVRELGFVAKNEAGSIGDIDAPKLESFKVYLGELGLSKPVLTDPYRSQGLWPEELDWLMEYSGPAA